MTVTDLLRAIQAAYPGASSEALAAFVPVYHARLRGHEGERLAEAATAVLGTFNATTRKPFPIPADFEAHLPSGKLHLSSSGPVIDFASHKRCKDALVAAWLTEQGAKIKPARGPAIYAHCLWEAQRQAGQRAWSTEPDRVVLSTDQIGICEDQAVSSARMDAHGAAVLRFADVRAWQAQIDNCRALLRAGEWPKRMVDQPGEGGGLPPVSQAMKDRLAALANARRQGRPPSQPEMHEAMV